MTSLFEEKEKEEKKKKEGKEGIESKEIRQYSLRKSGSLKYQVERSFSRDHFDWLFIQNFLLLPH